MIKNSRNTTLGKCGILFFISFALFFVSNCTLKSGKNLESSEYLGVKNEFKYNLSNEERKNLSGQKINFSKLSLIWSDGKVEEKNITTSLVFDNRIFDISTNDNVKHFPFTNFVQNISKSDTGYAINLEPNSFIRKAFLRKDYSSLIAFTVKKQLSGKESQVLKMVFTR